MAEESEGKLDSLKKTYKHNQNAKTFENGWIVCRSAKRPGFLYNFNTLTGESEWRDSQDISPDAAIVDKNKVPFECHEPTDLPVEPKAQHRKAQYQQKPPAHAGPKIYNKQVINNQFPAKPFALDPFGNAACAPYGIMNTNNAISMGPPLTNVWVAGAPPVLLGAPVTALNPVPTMFGGLQSLKLQNTSVTLSNRFQILKQMNHEPSTAPDLLNGDSDHQSFINSNHILQRQNRNFVKKEYNRPKDLRNILSSRRRQDFQNLPNDNSETKEHVSAIIAENELNPDDKDEWLEANADSEGKKLNVDIDGIWVLANSSASRDCWYIIPTTRALLNNMRFINCLVNTDERLRVLAPQEVVRALRSAAFSARGLLSDAASRARTLLATRLMNKLPSNLKDAANFKSCRELIGANTHIVHLIDEKDNLGKDSTNGVQITATELKGYLKPMLNSDQKFVTKIQKIADIQIVVPNTKPDKSESLPRVIRTPAIQEATKKSPLEVSHLTPKTENDVSKEIPIQTEPVNTVTSSTVKRTANACVQTDLDLTQIHFEIRPKEITNSQATESEASDNNIKAGSRKIKLRRPQNSTNTSANTDEKKTFRWRKRKDTVPAADVTPSQGDSQRDSRASSPPSTCTSNLLAFQNDNAMDCVQSDASIHADIVVESSTSGVISNSIESDSMFKINKQAILSQPKADRKEIAMYEITSDCMEDRLSLRCDEWMSRFVQIMEEALSQVLLLEPASNDETLPAPWTIEEATECIKRKFKDDSLVVDASERLIRYLQEIDYDSGNIETRIRPTEFMQMYSYGVDLVDKLKLFLKDCEDLTIASDNLTKLLSDIREPNLDESYDMENLRSADTNDFSPNISGTVTDLSTTVQDPAPATTASPQKEGKHIHTISSPRYSLRSSRSAEQKEKGKTTCSENNAYTLFASLGLKRTIANPPRSELKTSSSTPTQDLVDKTIQDVKENEIARVEPTIIRSFTINPELEKRLKGMTNNGIETNENYANGDCPVDNPVEDEYSAYDFNADDYLTSDYIDFSGDKNAISEPCSENNSNNVIEMTSMAVDQNHERTNLGDLNASEILKRVVQFTTHKYRRWLKDLHTFCMVTAATIKCTDYSQPVNHASVVEKTGKVSEHAKNVCHRLKCILNREPYVTIQNFRGLMKEYGIHDFDMSATQLAEYQVLIERYLKLAEQLLTCVTRLAASAKAK